jgi:hypothetical protein
MLRAEVDVELADICLWHLESASARSAAGGASSE